MVLDNKKAAIAHIKRIAAFSLKPSNTLSVCKL